MMSDQPRSLDLTLALEDNHRQANFCGQLDEHLKQIERRLGIEINYRGSHFHLIGEAESVRASGEVLQSLYAATKDEVLASEKIYLFLHESGIGALLRDDADHQGRGLVRPRGINQQEYLHKIVTHDINFGVGLAGTGKIYFAVACVVDALDRDQVRLAVEAGEKLGFLPGDLAQKINPYHRSLYDALY